MTGKSGRQMRTVKYTLKSTIEHMGLSSNGNCGGVNTTEVGHQSDATSAPVVSLSRQPAPLRGSIPVAKTRDSTAQMRSIILLCIAAVASAAIHHRNPLMPLSFFGRPTGGFLHAEKLRECNELFQGGLNNRDAHASVSSDQFAATIETFYVTQPIDHSNPPLGTWQQRVQYNPRFYRNESIIFLLIGGESPAAEKWVAQPNITYLRWAEKYGAAVFQLEHRFFGKSRPYNDLKTSSLKYCTVDQALEDLASFIRQMNAKYGYVNPRWVTFGGSYPGKIAECLVPSQVPRLNSGCRGEFCSSYIFARLLWQVLVVIQTNSQHPSQFSYAMVMENVIRNTSAECHEKIGNAITVILNKALTVAGREELSTKLKLKPAFNETTLTVRDLHNMMAYLFGGLQNVVQYTYDARNSITMGGFNVRNMCNAITSSTSTDPVIQMRAIIDWIYTFYPSDDGTIANRYSDLIGLLSNTTFDDENGSENAAMRGWMWLCCNELGVLQTTDHGRNIFGNMLPLNYFIDICIDAFGDTVNIVSIRDNNLAFRNRYGDANNYKAKNIVLPNGSFDPWHPLGTYENYPELHQKAILIEGTAHCADMYPPWSEEPSTLAPVRAEIEAELEYFIKESSSEATTAASEITTSTSGVIAASIPLLATTAVLVATH
uniref:Serine carboxypeptidase S28 n=2 Tax=Ascaris TaxID=6251 RepID=A0A9J2PV96_ASCLU